MDEDAHIERGIPGESRNNADGPPTGQYTGAFFPRAEHFVINGGSFISIKHPPPSDLPNFRRIPMGDLDLRHEIRENAGSTVAHRRRGKNSVRRMYSAHIHGSNSAMTAVLYQGEGAEKQWRAEISRYSNLRHPNLLQIYGISSTGGVHAAVFHDDLVTHGDFLEKYDNSHFSTIFFWACIEAHLRDASEYLSLVCGRPPHWSDYTPWIRPSIGLLIIELTLPESLDNALAIRCSDFKPFKTYLLTPPPASEIIRSISLVDYHLLCNCYMSWDSNFTLSTKIPLQLGSIRHFPGTKYKTSFEVAFLQNVRVIDDGWLTEDPNIQDYWIISENGISTLENGVNSACIDGDYRRRIYSSASSSEGWLAQAYHIFNSLDIKSNLEDYVLVYAVDCDLQLLGPIENLPIGYLFLGPLTEFETDVPGCFNIPHCPAYWSQDPSGWERFTAEEGRNHGFPDIKVTVKVLGSCWSSSVYAGIRQFHKAKGFDPDGQDVAIEFGYPLFRGSCTRDDLLAHLREIETDDDDSESDGMSGGDDYESISDDDEDVVDTESASDFDSKMIEPAVPDVEMVSSGDNDVHEEASISSDCLEEEEVFAMLHC